MAAVHFSDQDFEEEVIKSDKPVLVDFYADWCGPCKMAAPIIDELSDEYEGKAVVGKVNVDENSGTAQKYGVMSIPNFIIFKSGRPVDRVIGAVGKRGLEMALRKHLKN